MRTFEKSTILSCTREELFDFHLDIENLKKITPDDMVVDILNLPFVAKEGNIVEIKSTKGFISTIWKVKIEKLERPNILVDKALKSPFKYWEHSHVFIKRGNKTELKDVVKYEIPFGKIGDLLLNFFIKKELEKMFSFRHKRTKELFDSYKECNHNNKS